jgi:hypothetical protein
VVRKVPNPVVEALKVHEPDGSQKEYEHEPAS